MYQLTSRNASIYTLHVKLIQLKKGGEVEEVLRIREHLGKSSQIPATHYGSGLAGVGPSPPK